MIRRFLDIVMDFCRLSLAFYGQCGRSVLDVGLGGNATPKTLRVPPALLLAVDVP